MSTSPEILPSPEQCRTTLSDAGFRQTDHLIQVLLVGSHQHGARLPGTGDIDIAGVYIEHPNKVLGVQSEEHFTSGTADQYEKNQAGDEDYKVYTLKRWAGLACKGNPTILGYMFSPSAWENTVWATHILPNKSVFMAKSHANAFFGFATSQVMRLKGEKGRGKKGQRPELEQKFGYDVKAAMHLIRMMYECQEFLTSGVITYPRPEKDTLIAIRSGTFSIEQVFTLFGKLEQKVKQAELNSPLPDHVDRVKVSEIITDAYLTHWRKTGLLQENRSGNLYAPRQSAM